MNDSIVRESRIDRIGKEGQNCWVLQELGGKLGFG